jgi:hypothetical protein
MVPDETLATASNEWLRIGLAGLKRCLSSVVERADQVVNVRSFQPPGEAMGVRVALE